MDASASVLNSQIIHFKWKSYFRHTAAFIFPHQSSGQLCTEDIYFFVFYGGKNEQHQKKKKKKQVHINRQRMFAL